MVDSCGMGCVKYLVFFFNLIFVISGIALLSLGLVIRAAFHEYADFLGDEKFNAPMILIIVGVIIFLIAFFGCCGAVKENSCMLSTFAVLLALILVAEVAAGILAYIYKGELKEVLRTNMKKSIVNYNQPSAEGYTNTWNIVQNELKCCGIDNYKDWTLSNLPKSDLPDSCCKVDSPGCGQNFANNMDNFNQNGCLSAVEAKLKDNIAIVGGVGIGIALIQVVGIIFACCLSKSIKQHQLV